MDEVAWARHCQRAKQAEEIYVTVKATAKEAEKVIREKFPNARKDQKPGLTSYTCKDRSGHISLMFIRDENI